jgi:NAD(P)H dehydrogenase (quinone)
MTVLVTGANGEFGRAVLAQVRRLAPELAVIATVRDIEAATGAEFEGVDVRAGNFDEPALAGAFAGADTVFLNATFFGVAPELRGARVANAIAAASSAERILLTTWPDLDNCPIPAVAGYRDSERQLRSAGPDWTILRLGAGLGDAVARDVVWGIRDGEIVAPAGDARATPAAIDDLAEAAAVAITGAGHENRVYELTGPDAVSWPDLARLAGELDGRDIPFRDLDDAEYRARLAGQSLPPSLIDGLLDLYGAFRSGWNAKPTATLGELIGRAPVAGIDAVRQRAERQR